MLYRILKMIVEHLEERLLHDRNMGDEYRKAIADTVKAIKRLQQFH